MPSCLFFQVGLGVWGAGGQGRNPRGNSGKTRPSLPPSSLSVGWSQVSEGGWMGTAHVLHVDLDGTLLQGNK